MHRFFLDAQGLTSGVGYLDAQDARHALKVLRLEEGAEIVLLDGENAWLGRILSIEGDLVQAQAVDHLRSTEPQLTLTLYQGLPKGDKMDWIVQKGTEIGVAAFVPVAMERSVLRIAGKDGEKKRDRWQKIAREASKQSGRCRIPQVYAPRSYSQALEMMGSHGQVLIPWEEAHGVNIAAVRQENGALDVGLLIGPEGGISEKEISLAMQAVSALPVTLGPRILRTETAGLAAACALFTLSGDL